MHRIDAAVLLDPSHATVTEGAALVLRVVRGARERGLGVIFISHTLPHVLEVTDRIGVLRLGRVVVDEPTSRLDEASAAAVAQLLAEIAARGDDTVICATHDPEVIRYADRVLELGVEPHERQPISP